MGSVSLRFCGGVPTVTAFQLSPHAFFAFVWKFQSFRKMYEPLNEIYDASLSFIKVINAGRSFYVNNVNGHVQSRVVYFLMNIHLLPRSIYLTRVRFFLTIENQFSSAFWVFVDHDRDLPRFNFAIPALILRCRELNPPSLVLYHDSFKKKERRLYFLSSSSRLETCEIFVNCCYK